MSHFQTTVKPSDSSEQLICNIHYFFYAKFVFGYYHEFQMSKPLRWLARCYCCLVFTGIAAWMYSFDNDLYNTIITINTSCEYLFYMIFSFLKANKYLLQYYKRTPIIDSSINNYKTMSICILVYMCLLFTIKIMSQILVLVFYGDCDLLNTIYAVLEGSVWISITMGRLSVFFVFVLLYTRVRLMRKAMESNNFDCRKYGKNHPRRYMQMYEAIMDGLEESDGPVKQQLFIFMVVASISLFSGFLEKFYEMKIVGTLKTVELLWYSTEVLLLSSPVFLSATLVDLVTLEMQDIMGIVVERRITSKNERDRAEIQKLFELLKSHPFKYSLWRVVPLNVRCLLSFASFCVTTIIAILQIQDWATSS